MSKHTPGPWYSIGAEVFKDIGDQRWAVAVAHDWSEETAENARLIAAAPELLEALSRLVADGDVRDAAELGAIKQARAAIRKATGE